MPVEGEHVPLAVFPRFTTLTSATTFWSAPLDLLEFQSWALTFFRSVITGGGSPTILFHVEGSSDLIRWDTVHTPFDPSASNVEGSAQRFADTLHRYLRIGVELDGTTSPTVTVYVIGYAVRTQG
jgi:hypothetical protein